MNKRLHKKGSLLSLMLLLCLAPFLMGSAPPQDDDEYSRAVNPYICATDYEVVSGSVEAGQAFTLKVEITNVSTSADAYNVMVSYFFTGNDGFYQVEGETNQRFIESIEKGETKELFFNLQVKENIYEPMVFFEVNFSYLNVHGISYSNQTLFSVYQKDASILILQSFSLPEQSAIDKRTLVNLQLRNGGKTNLKDIALTLSGDFIDSPQVYTFDKIAPGEINLIDAYITFTQPGNQRVNASVTYANELGDSLALDTAEKEILIMQPQENGASVGTDGEGFITGKTFWFYICVACIGLVALALVWLLLNSKQKRGRR